MGAWLNGFMETDRERDLDILARGASCPACGAWVDEPCTTPRGIATDPHHARIVRAVRAYSKYIARHTTEA